MISFRPAIGGLDAISLVTIGTGNGLSINADQALSLALSSGSTTGALSSTDWNTFNNKQAAGSYITALTGDATASGPGSAALTLATVNSNVGSFGSSTSIPSFTVNAKGLITAAAGNAVVAPAGTLTGTTLAANVVTSSLTTVGTIASGNWQAATIAVARGGTGNTSYTDGQLLIGNTTGNTLVKTTLTAGTNITVTNGAGSITLDVPSPTPAAFNYTAQTTTYSAVINDYVNASGSSFTITLPTAVGQSGKQIIIQHSGTSFVQTYTLNTTSSQTIGGQASGAVALYTNGEKFILTSNGANWLITVHGTITAWAAYVPASSQGLGTLASTNLYRRRVGDTIEIRGRLVLGTVTSAEARLDFIATGETLTSTANITTSELAGKAARSSAVGGGMAILIQPSVSYMNFGITTSGLVETTINTGTTNFDTGNTVFIFARIACAGLQA